MQKRELYCTLAMNCHTLQVHNILYISVPSHNMATSPDILQDLIAYHQIKEKVYNHTQCLLHKTFLNGPEKNKFFEHKTQCNENIKITFIYEFQFCILTTMSYFTIFQLLTLRLLMSYIYGAPILDVSRSHTTTQHSR